MKVISHEFYCVCNVLDNMDVHELEALTKHQA